MLYAALSFVVSPTEAVDLVDEAEHRRLTDNVFTIADALVAQCDAVPDVVFSVFNDPFTMLWGAIVVVVFFYVSRREYEREYGSKKGGREGGRRDTPRYSRLIDTSISPDSNCDMYRYRRANRLWASL